MRSGKNLRRRLLVGLALLGGMTGAQVLFDTDVALAQPAARAWFGVEVAARKDNRPGVLVRHVVRTSPADSAGIKDGDALLRLGAKPLAAPGDVISEVRARKPGEVLDVLFERGGHEQKARVTLSVFPATDEMLRRDKVGTFAPPLIGLQGVQGKVPDNLGQLKGKVVVLDFWAGWCGVCKLITPVLNRWQDKLGPQGVVVLGVSSDTPQVATKAMNEFGIKYAVGVDKDETVFPAYGVSALPTMFVLDKKGVVRSIEVGFDVAELAKTEALLATLVAEPAP
jgi:thiol-disulfide isomerase/thioredoxin